MDPTQAFDKGRNPLAIEVDHVVPRLGARLETESPADLRPLHRRCNRERHWAAVAVVEAIEVEQLSLFS